MKKKPTKSELKDIFKATKHYCIMINRLGNKLKDYYKMMETKEEALYMIAESAEEFRISESMQNFLARRILQTPNSKSNY